MWNRVELKEDSKTLLRLNYWPFVLVAFISAITGYAAFGSDRVFRLMRMLDGDDEFHYHNGYNYNYDYNEIMYDALSYILPFLGIAAVVVLGMWVVRLLLQIFVFGPLGVGCIRYMTISRQVKPQFGEIGFAFRNCYVNIVKTLFLQNVYIFLWSLLFVIPGIIKSYEYRMVPYLMAEYPDMASSEAFRISREMMMGNKSEAFVMDLSFLGWNLLSGITFGVVGVFYAYPYQMLTDAALYLVLKQTNPSLGYVKPDTNYYL